MTKRPVAPFLIAALLVGALSGCKVGPDYVPPEVEMPDQWHYRLTDGLADGTAPLHTWWTALQDPVLDELIRMAGQGNPSLRVAMARIEEARSQSTIAGSEWYPQVNAQGDAFRRRSSENVINVPGIQRPQNYFRLGFDALWELDVWGRIARGVESADANVQAEIENYRDVLVVLYGEVGVTYLEVRSLQQRIRYAESNVEAQKGSLQLTKDRYEAEIAPELDVRQAELNLASTESNIPSLKTALDASINRLAALVGGHPGPLHELLDAPAPIPVPEGEIVIGVPGDILRQRPDIRRAERDLAAQTARIGVATAELYPRFSLVGSLGLESVDASDLFKGSSRFWDVGLPFVWQIFQGGRLRANIAVEDARTEQALATYEQTVLLAIEEVETALIAYIQERVRRDALARAVVAAERSVELVEVLYKTGVTNFQNVLDMQRSLFQQQDQLAESEGLVIQNLIRLYKALGGGWSPEEPVLPEEGEEEATDATASGS